MAESFVPGCYADYTLQDVIERLPSEERTKHVGLIPMDAVVAKIIWSREACSKFHQFSPDSYVDNTLGAEMGTNTDMEVVDNDDCPFGDKTCRCSLLCGGEVISISDDEDKQETVRWPAVEQPSGTGLRGGEVLVPAGMEDPTNNGSDYYTDSDTDTVDYDWEWAELL